MNYTRHTSSSRILSSAMLMSFLFLSFFVLVAASSAADQLDINHASASQIQAQLPGIGKVKAQAIVDYRSHHGPFERPEQLLEIKGIGPYTFGRIRSLIHFNDAQSPFFSQLGEQNLNTRDQAIRRDIKRIVTRAKQATHE